MNELERNVSIIVVRSNGFTRLEDDAQGHKGFKKRELTVSMRSCGVVRGIIVLGEDAAAILCAEDQDGLHGEEGHIRSHDCDRLYRIEREMRGLRDPK